MLYSETKANKKPKTLNVFANHKAKSNERAAKLKNSNHREADREQTNQNVDKHEIDGLDDSSDILARANPNLRMKLVDRGRKQSNRYDLEASKEISGSKFQGTAKMLLDETSNTASLPEFLFSKP